MARPVETIRQWTERDNRALAALWQEQGMKSDPPRSFESGALIALLAREPAGGGPERWHISVSHADRIPSWEEMVAACHDLRPGVAFHIGIPPASMWLNIHPNVLHAWEAFDPWMVREYAQNAVAGHRST